MRTQIAATIALTAFLVLTVCIKDPLRYSATNNPPVMEKVIVNPDTVQVNAKANIFALASDPDGDSLWFSWTSPQGSLAISSDTASLAMWTAPATAGNCTIQITIDDKKERSTLCTLVIPVVEVFDSTNHNPVIDTITAPFYALVMGDTVDVTVTANDFDHFFLNYTWEATGGSFLGNSETVGWIAPMKTGDYLLSVTAADDDQGSDVSSIMLTVISSNNPPVLTPMTAIPDTVPMGGTVAITISASDLDGDSLTWTYETFPDYYGGLFSGQPPNITWAAPLGSSCCTPGPYELLVKVSDGKGGIATAAVTVEVTLD